MSTVQHKLDREEARSKISLLKGTKFLMCSSGNGNEEA